jgi:phage internal scaffolding protein
MFNSAYSERIRKQTCYKDDEGFTHQEQKQQCDINYILEKYRRTGVVNHLNKYQEQYLDVSAIDFQDAQNKVATVSSMFEELPAQERARFNHDPAQFLEFVATQENRDDMKDGIIGNNSTTGDEVSSSSDVESTPSGDKE